MARSKIHHFVAQSILKRFKDKNGNLWYYDPRSGRKVEHRNTQTIFQIRNDNTFKAGNASHDDLEKAYGAFDDDWMRTTHEMISVVLSNKLPAFDSGSRQAVFEMLHRQQWRSPDRIHDRDYTDIFSRAQKETEQKLGPLPDAMLEDEETMRRLEHNAKVAARAQDLDPATIAGYEAFDLVFIKTSVTFQPFIMGSAIRTHADGLSIFPLSPRIALALKYPANGKPEVIRITSGQSSLVRTANINMAKGSKYGIAGCQKKQILQLSKYCPKP